MAYESYLSNSNVRAFLDMIGQAEGADYWTLVNRGSFNHALSSLAQHPNVNVSGSTAAGKYQFLYRTWAGLGLPNFSPEMQDLGAVMLIAQAGALNDVANGKIQTAIQKTNRVWASFPGSPYGQGTKSLPWMLQQYARFGGQIDSGSAIVVQPGSLQQIPVETEDYNQDAPDPLPLVYDTPPYGNPDEQSMLGPLLLLGGIGLIIYLVID